MWRSFLGMSTTKDSALMASRSDAFLFVLLSADEGDLEAHAFHQP
jgi:hypothetical protein